MKDSNKLSKREFLKLMGGLSLGLLPFVGCFNREHNQNEKLTETPDTPIAIDKIETEYDVSDKDVIVLSQNDATYTQHNILFNKRLAFLPKYIAICFTPLGIQYAIQRAKKEKLKIAVKSGGHSFEGFSSNNDGMVINVSRMKKITWNKDGTINVEPGVLLKEVQEQIYAKGKLLPAGSCGGVAVAGLTLGGGYGFFSRKYGLTCDSLLDATLITADEKSISAKDDNDLLWALKGGGNGNFGVISSFVFKTYPCPATFSTYTAKHLIADADSFSNILERWMNAVKQLPEEAFGAFVQNSKMLTLLFTNYGKSSIEHIATQFSNNAKSFSSSLNKPLVPSLKRFHGRLEPLFFKNASCGYFHSYQDLAKITTEIYKLVLSQPGIIFQINTLGGAINNPDFKKASCYPHRSFDFLGELQGYYDRKAQETGVLAAFNGIQKLIKDSGVSAHYRNYPDINFKDWQHAYYGENYASLQKIKSKYDAQNLFQYPQSIVPET